MKKPMEHHHREGKQAAIDRKVNERLKRLKRFPNGIREEEVTALELKGGPKSGADILDKAAATYRERNAVYGDNFLMVGEIMKAMFPKGVTLRTAHDHNRFHIFMLQIVKLSRYVINWESGHQDSIHDNTVYSAMLESIDHNGPR